MVAGAPFSTCRSRLSRMSAAPHTRGYPGPGCAIGRYRGSPMRLPCAGRHTRRCHRYMPPGGERQRWTCTTSRIHTRGSSNLPTAGLRQCQTGGCATRGGQRCADPAGDGLLGAWGGRSSRRQARRPVHRTRAPVLKHAGQPGRHLACGRVRVQEGGGTAAGARGGRA
jgi:hypothetical protein